MDIFSAKLEVRMFSAPYRQACTGIRPDCSLDYGSRDRTVIRTMVPIPTLVGRAPLAVEAMEAGRSSENDVGIQPKRRWCGL